MLVSIQLPGNLFNVSSYLILKDFVLLKMNFPFWDLIQRSTEIFSYCDCFISCSRKEKRTDGVIPTFIGPMLVHQRKLIII